MRCPQCWTHFNPTRVDQTKCEGCEPAPTARLNGKTEEEPEPTVKGPNVK
jgi:hypothetical protein